MGVLKKGLPITVLAGKKELKQFNCFALLMLPCLLCSKIDGGTLLGTERHLAPCVAVPKGPGDKDSNKAESSEMVHRHRGRSHPYFRCFYLPWLSKQAPEHPCHEGPRGRSRSSGGTEPALLAECCPRAWATSAACEETDRSIMSNQLSPLLWECFQSTT